MESRYRPGGEVMGRIKVLHIIGGGEFGGAEQYLLTLARHMDRSEFELHTACLFSEPFASRIREEGFTAHVFPMRSKIDWKPIGNIASLIKTEGFRIVHTHGVRANLIGRLAARRSAPCHVITTVHSVLAFDYSKRLDRLVNRISETCTRGITEKFIAVSKMLCQQLISEGIPPDKIVTVYNGLEIEKYNPETSGLTVRQEFNISPDAVVAGIVARLHPVKGHPCLFQAMAEVVRKLPNLLLMVVGAGPDKTKLQELADRLGIGKNVIFTGFRKDIPEIISALDFLVLPSVCEGLGLSIMEGMAMKKPVLATRVGGIPEIITSGIDGLLVPPADVPALAAGIQQLAADREAAAKLGEAARKTIETRFTAETMARETARLYREIIRG